MENAVWASVRRSVHMPAVGPKRGERRTDRFQAVAGREVLHRLYSRVGRALIR